MKNSQSFAEDYMKKHSIMEPDQKKYISYITTILHTASTKTPICNEFLDDFILFFTEKNTDEITIPYDYIALYIYHHDVIFEFRRLETTFHDINEKLFMCDTIQQCRINKVELTLEKIKRNIQLAIHQKKFIEKQLNKTNSLVSTMEQKAIDIEEDSKNLQKNIYTNFITILGVFTAIIVTVFGSFSAISDAVKKYQSSTEYLFLITTGLFFIAVLIYILFGWIERIKKQRTSLSPLLGLLLLGISSLISYIFTLL